MAVKNAIIAFFTAINHNNIKITSNEHKTQNTKRIQIHQSQIKKKFTY